MKWKLTTVVMVAVLLVCSQMAVAQDKYISVCIDENREITEKKYGEFAKFLNKNIESVNHSIKVYSSPKDIEQDIKSGALRVAFLEPGCYIKLKKHHGKKLELLAKLEINRKIENRSVILYGK